MKEVDGEQAIGDPRCCDRTAQQQSYESHLMHRVALLEASRSTTLRYDSGTGRSERSDNHNSPIPSAQDRRHRLCSQNVSDGPSSRERSTSTAHPLERHAGGISIHSDAACFFDPLGLVGSVVVQAKIFIQELWLLKCDWNDPLDESLQAMRTEYKQNMVALESLSIPRWLGVSNDCTEVQLYGFCDALEAAYEAYLYLRCTASDDTVTVRLITLKSRLAPLETLQRVSASSASNCPWNSCHLHLWTDSMIVKCWLASLPSRWLIVVANRMSEIQHLTNDEAWGHVPGTVNPADLIFRGMSPAHLLSIKHLA